MTRPHGRSRQMASATIILSFVTLIAGITWAAVAQIDQVSRAQGRLIPTAKIQLVQSADGGKIVRVLVREGDRVIRGQLLVSLDDREAQARIAEAESRIAALQIANERIRAELEGHPPNFDADLGKYSALTLNQIDLYRRRVAEQAQAIAFLEHVVEIESKDFESKRLLAEKGLVSKTVLLAQEQSLAEAEGQLEARRNNYLQTLQSDYAKNGEELAVVREQLNQHKASFDNLQIRAPVDGIVKNVRLTTVGGVYRPGDEVLEIVPVDDALVLEAKLPPSAISSVHLGQTASVKFDAYDSGIFGSASGRVTYISADTLSETKMGSELSYYSIHLSVDTSQMREHDGIRVDLQPGMTATVEIKGVKNTVLNFLLKPVTKTLSDSFGER